MSLTKQAFIVAFLQGLAAAAPAITLQAPVFDQTCVSRFLQEATPVLNEKATQVKRQAPPSTFTANGAIGPGGTVFTDSAHFRVYGVSGTQATQSLNMLEASYSCYVDALGWRSSGLSFNDKTDADGPWTKVNVYSVAQGSLGGGVAGVMRSDARTGMAWLEVVATSITNPGVLIHEFGRTGAWWETLANWFADTYKTSALCDAGRAKYGVSASSTSIRLESNIGDSWKVIVDGTSGSANHYEAWPFLSYLTYNPDNYAGLGWDTLRQAFLQYSRNSNETPLNTFARLSTSKTIQQVVGRYWARMAFADIGHPTANQVWLNTRSLINYANYDATSNNNYEVKTARQPRYMGSNITPLKKTGAVTVTARITTSGQYTGTLSIRNTSTGATRYVDFANGSATAAVAANEEAFVVVANTPALILYDAFAIPAEVSRGLDYTLNIQGATI